MYNLRYPEWTFPFSAHRPSVSDMVNFTVLGPITAFNGHLEFTPRTPKVRQIFALLLSRLNHVVTFDALVEELWDAERPKTALTTAQTYVYQLRKATERELGESLVSKPFGYVLRAVPQQLDAHRFERLVEEGKRALHIGALEESSQKLSQALALCEGPPLANVTRGPLLGAYAVHLEEERLRALELRIQADMRLGRHRELVAELRSLVITHPHHEWLHGQLISALSLSGRRSEALQAYRTIRTILSDDLGLDPSRELHDLHQAVLSADRG